MTSASATTKLQMSFNNLEFIYKHLLFRIIYILLSNNVKHHAVTGKKIFPITAWCFIGWTLSNAIEKLVPFPKALLASGGNRHSEPGRNRQSWSIWKTNQFSRQFRRNACVALPTWLSRTQQVTSHPWQPCRNCWGVIKATNLTICSPMLSILECSRACFWEVVSWLSLLRFESLAISTWLKLAIFAWRYLVISTRPEHRHCSLADHFYLPSGYAGIILESSSVFWNSSKKRLAAPLPFST